MTEASRFNRPAPEIEILLADKVQALFDGTMTEPEAKELLQWWDRSPDVASALQANCFLEQVLQLHDAFYTTLSPELLEKLKSSARKTFAVQSSQTEPLKTKPSFDTLDFDMLASLAARSPSLPKSVDDPADSTESFSSPRRKALRPVKTIPAPLIFALSFFLLAVAAWLEFRPPSKPEVEEFHAVARIAESVEAEWEEGTEAYKVGRELEPCSLKLKSGIVKVEFGSGVGLILEGPTELLVKGRNMAFCSRGKLSVDVPPAGIGFEVATPTATVVDLGTRFSVEVLEGRTDVHVVKGKVEVRQAAKEKLLLTEGLAGLFELNAKTQTLVADLATFFGETKLWERKTSYVARRKAVWEEQSRRRSADDALRYQLDAAGQNRLPTASGSRDDRKSARFRTQRDALDVSLPGAYRNLTLVAVVRIADMRNYTSTLCMGAGFLDGGGEFFWQMSNTGVLRFHVRNERLECYDSGPAVDRKDWHTWLQLAVVADAEHKEVRHYVDSRRVATLPWENPSPLKMPEGSIGNVPREQRTRSPRNWNGDIDSFDVFSRAFSDVEIAELYENLR